MSSVLLVGLGDVGVRAARQLLDTPGVDRVLVAAHDVERARAVAVALHDGVEAIDLPGDDSLPRVDVIASALPAGPDGKLARRAVDASIPFASVADDEAAIRVVLDLEERARDAGVRIITGCGLAPGLGDVLARHAVDVLDTVDELHVARWGFAGAACAESARRAHRLPALEWRDGVLLHDRRHGPELAWFPDPIGARECAVVGTGVELLVAVAPSVTRATCRLGVPAARRFRPDALGRREVGGAWGAVRVEAWGWRDHARASVVYGVIERTAVAAGTVLAVTAAALAGALPELVPGDTPGATGLGAVVKSAPFLAELARRGVKAAAFEGVAVG